jgi:hypothetical protein
VARRNYAKHSCHSDLLRESRPFRYSRHALPHIWCIIRVSYAPTLMGTEQVKGADPSASRMPETHDLSAIAGHQKRIPVT